MISFIAKCRMWFTIEGNRGREGVTEIMRARTPFEGGTTPGNQSDVDGSSGSPLSFFGSGRSVN